MSAVAPALDLVALALALATALCARRSCRWLDTQRVAADAVAARPRWTAPPAAGDGASSRRDAAAGGDAGAGAPRVSLLVPARNEAANVAACVAGLAAQDLPGVEALLLDDASEDGTAALARAAFTRAAPGVRWTVVDGDGPPPGWTGKTFACERLAERAGGEWLFFLDADTRLAPDGARRALAAALASGADLVSFLPRYRGAHWVNRLVVPWLYHWLIALVPLPEVTRLAHPRLAVGNGQALLVHRTAYRRLGGHAAVRAAVIEDVALAIAAKQSGLRIALADGARWLDCELYADAGEAARGFRKNFQAAARLYPAQWLALVAVLALVGLWPWSRLLAGDGAGLALATAALTTLTVAGLVRRFRQSALAVACWPLALAWLLAVAASGGALAITRRPIRWRGRAVGAALAAVVIVAPSLPSRSYAEPARAPLAGLTLDDRQGTPWRLDELTGVPVVIVVGDRATQADANRWGERLGSARAARFAPWRSPGLVTLLSVARLPDVPSFVRPTVVRLLPDPPAEQRRTSPLLLDWGGRLAARLGLGDDAAAVIVLGAAHDEQARASGPPDDAAVARLLAAIDEAGRP